MGPLRGAKVSFFPATTDEALKLVLRIKTNAGRGRNQRDAVQDAHAARMLPSHTPTSVLVPSGGHFSPVTRKSGIPEVALPDIQAI
jgi:hypothetical protein